MIRSHFSAGRHALTLAAASLFGAILFSSAALGQTNVDLNTWSQKGPTGNGNWNVDPSGDFVVQTINGEPTYFVSPGDFFNTTVEGTFQVQTTGDDDFIGFVFGYNEPGENATDATFSLLSWKQGNQSGTEAGFRLARVNGLNTPPFGSAEDDNLPNYDVWAINTTSSNPGNIAGWADNTEYEFDLLYTNDRIKVDITGGTGVFQSGLTVFDIAPADIGLAGSFATGQFGFFNFSQANVRYESFTLTEPALATTPGDGGTLSFLTRVGDSTTEIINVANAGGAGTTLSGTAGAPAGAPFSGPSEVAGFSLGSAADTDFTYTYSPSARTAGTPDNDAVSITSNEDGMHTVNLSGLALGPVSEFAFDSNSINPSDTLDFGVIDSDTVQTLSFLIANASPDDNGGLNALTDLTIADIQITGPDASKFSHASFTPGAVVSQAGELMLDLTFDPADMVGVYAATLTVSTDQNAALGGDGADFVFQLTGESLPVVPEPASVLLLIAGLLANCVGRFKRC